MKILFMIFAILWASLALADDATEKITNQHAKFVSTVKDSNIGSPVRLMFEISSLDDDGVYFGVGKEYVDENIAAIEKYIQWTNMAKQKGDSVDKTVAVAKGTEPVAGYLTLIEYKISSGYGTHFLTITPGRTIFGGFKPLVPSRSSASQVLKLLSSKEPEKEEGGSILLSEVEAKIVLQKLVAFKEGKISKTNKDDYQ